MKTKIKSFFHPPSIVTALILFSISTSFSFARCGFWNVEIAPISTVVNVGPNSPVTINYIHTSTPLWNNDPDPGYNYWKAIPYLTDVNGNSLASMPPIVVWAHDCSGGIINFVEPLSVINMPCNLPTGTYYLNYHIYDAWIANDGMLDDISLPDQVLWHNLITGIDGFCEFREDGGVGLPCYVYNIVKVNYTAATLPTISTSSTNSDCAVVPGTQTGTGTATIFVSGGNPPYTYYWTPSGQTTATALNLVSGFNSVTYTDVNGCSGTQSILVNSNTVYNYVNPIISSTINWSGNINILGLVTIENNGVLTINNSHVEFSYDGFQAGVLVKPGGLLIIDNTTLTGCQDGQWNEITVKSIYGTSNGTVIIQNNSEIRNANIGVHSVEGGIIQAVYSDFENNFIGARIDGAFPGINLIDNSHFINCHFSRDMNAYFGSAYTSHIMITSTGAQNSVISGPQIENCSFALNQNGINSNVEISGIKIFNAPCRIIGTSGNGNTFTGLTYGVYAADATSSAHLVINGNTFNNNRYGVYTQATYLDKITNNIFNIAQSPSPDIKTYGIMTTGSSGFLIQGNTFNSPQVNSKTYSMVFDNSGLSSSIVFNNNILQNTNSNLSTFIGIQCQTDNSFLKIRCNYFDQPGFTSLSVPASLRSRYVDTGGEFVLVWDLITPYLRNQGLNCNPSINSSTSLQENVNQAGNEWTNGCSTSGAYQDIFTDANFEYRAHELNVAQLPWTIPTCSNPVLWKTNHLHTCYSVNKTINSCNSSIAGIMNPGSDAENLASLSSLKSRYEIEIGQNPEIQSELEPELMDIEREIISIYCSKGDIYSIIQILSNSRFRFSEKLLAEIYLSQNRFGEVSSLLSQIEQEGTEESDNYVSYINILLSLAEEGKSFFEINETQQNSLLAIANSNTKVSFKAQSLLEMFVGSTFDHPIDDIILKAEERLAKADDPFISNINESANFVVVYPNPASSNFYLGYNLTGNYHNSYITIKDVLGRKILELPIVSSKANYSIDGSKLQNGMYFVLLVQENKIISQDKVIVNH